MLKKKNEGSLFRDSLETKTRDAANRLGNDPRHSGRRRFRDAVKGKDGVNLSSEPPFSSVIILESVLKPHIHSSKALHVSFCFWETGTILSGHEQVYSCCKHDFLECMEGLIK